MLANSETEGTSEIIPVRMSASFVESAAGLGRSSVEADYTIVILAQSNDVVKVKVLLHVPLLPRKARLDPEYAHDLVKLAK